MVAAGARRWQNVANSVVLTLTGSNMTIKLNQLGHAATKLFVVALLPVLAACSSVKLPNPFASDTPVMSSRPTNATAYVCADNKRFYVRMLNNGNDAWLIYPDHEVNLTKISGSKNQYSSGVITLVIDGADTMLTDGDKAAYTACKPQLVTQ
jgi:membrane-bound inhibitor of C-type lysozyme